MMTYLNLSLKIVLRDWKVEGSSEAFGQGGSGDTGKIFMCLAIVEEVALIFETAEFG